MKKLHLVLFLSFLFITNALKAQISYGGTPLSFGSDFRNSELAKASLMPYLLPRLDMERVKQEDASKPNNRFAAATSVEVTPQKAGLWQTLPNGDRLWRVMLQAQTEGVYGMVLLFDKFALPEGGKLFVYTTDKKTVLGSFTHENNHSSGVFAITLIKGREVVMEYYESANAKGKFELSLNRIDQAYKTGHLDKPTKDKKAYGPQDFGDSESCNLDVNCTALANDWQDEKRGAVRILVVDGGGAGWCSGSLINNTAQNDKPYVLTANHCGETSSATNLNQWIFYFNYEITNCGSSSEPTSQTMTGASLKANYEPSDFFLVELNQNVPANYNPYFNGWDRTGNNHTGSYGIHHPSGDVKKFSRDIDATMTTSYFGDVEGSGTTHFRVIWNNGTTEGGSSGSPLFESNGRIVGQLHGGGAACNATFEPDWYGKVSVSWTGGGTTATRLSSWLDPNNSGVTTLNGKNGGGSVANFTASPAQILYQPDAVTFTDASSGTITSRSWNFGAGASPATATTAGPHNITYSTAGTKTVTLAINANASTATKTITVLPALAPDYLLADGGNFETNTSHFAGVALSGTGFERGNSTIVGKNGVASGASAWVTGLTTTSYANQTEAHLYTPNFNFAVTGAYMLQFKTKFETEQNFDGFIVQYSTNKGTTWAQLGNAIATNWYNGTVASNVGAGGFAVGTKLFTGSISTYETKSFDVSFLAGNANVAFRFVFKTDDSVIDAGVAIDDFQIIGPLRAMTFLPANNATAVNVGANLQITFNRNVLKGTTGNVVLKRVSDNSIIETIAVTSGLVTVSGTTATINPTNNLPENTQVYVEIANGAFVDANAITYTGITGNNTWRFTTDDTTPPTLTTLSPAHNTTGVAVNTNLVMTFNENIKLGTGIFTIKKVSDNSVVASGLSGDAWVTANGATLTFNPPLDFEGITAYYAEISNGFVQDIAGNNYAGFSGSGTWQFTTIADLVAPTVVTYSPANGSTGVALNSNLVLTFNENVKKGTGNITIRKMSDNAVVENIAVTDGTVSIAGAVVTINPANDLPANTAYYVEVTAGAIQDLANNSYAGIVGNNTWNFTSLDNIAPTLNSFSPTHNATGVSISANLVMNFSENVKKGNAGAIRIKQASNNATVATFDVTSSNFTINGAVATLNPADFAFFTELYVEVDNGVIQDLAGNNFAGFTGNTTWKFKTANETTPPTITTFNPANNSQNFAGANNLTITFNENVKKGSAGNINIKKLSDNSVFESIAIADAKITVSGAVVTINPANDLTFNTEFYVEVSSGAIQDLADNNFAGFVGSATWKFKTDFSTAVEDNLVGKAITVYPNPTDRFATLLVQKGITLQNVSLRMIDVAGKTVWESHTKQLAEKQTFDWNLLPAGKYFLEIQSEQGKALKSIIKQ